MLSKGVAVWAKNYYYAGLGLEPPAHLPDPEEFYKSNYDTLFLKPAVKLLQGNSDTIVTPDDINRLLLTVKSLKIRGWIYTIKQVSEEFSSLIVPGDIRRTLQMVYDAFISNCYEALILTEDKKQIKGYVDAVNKIQGNYPSSVKYLMREVLLPYPDATLDIYLDHDPTTLPEHVRSALKVAVESGVYDKSQLKSVHTQCLFNGEEKDVVLTAIDDNLPPSSIYQLLKVLPEGMDRSVDASQFHTALRFLEEGSHTIQSMYSEQYVWLKNHLSVTPVTKTDKLTDEEINGYLFEKYGVTLEEVKQRRPVAKEMYTSALLMNDEMKNMTASDFVEEVNKAEDTMTGTLDDLIVQFCKEEGIPHECSIAQLIHAINYEGEVVPASFKERAIEYKAKRHISGETTLNEIIQGVDHTPIDEVALSIDLVKSCPNIDPVFKAKIVRCISDEEASFMSDETLVSLLETVDMPDDLRDAIESAVKGDGTVRVPDKEIDAAEISEKYIQSEFGVTLSEINKIVSNAEAAKESTDVGQSNDVGYSANLCMLKGIRSLLTDGVDGVDDDTVRTELMPLVYAYFRVLMLKAGDEKEAVEFLESKRSESSEYIRPFLEEAIALFDKD